MCANVSETRQSREAKCAIPRANALLSLSVLARVYGPERVRMSQDISCSLSLSISLFRSPVSSSSRPTIRGNEANAFRGPTIRKRIIPGRGSYRGNIGKLPPPRGRLLPSSFYSFLAWQFVCAGPHVRTTMISNVIRKNETTR